ncbi:amino acid transporter AVT1C-like [Alnus glutinosa]|uniref:amino acid transporter AVT1C-like n=1 Tax=Alnus glutinosa TaxID=3517 RepID=UPI002D77C4EF|nr:amino acid transporter AVT1C-like [Alnus glutinosa]XP_062154948.1 amino acid transporter AVT1C-like [Alnus glutinosa]XP_062154949.1 amino acid transporter AVT1C-like [Alnus glutinosa]
MNNSVSDHSFYIESDEEEDAQKEFDKGEGNNNDGNVSDYSDSSADDNPQQNKPSSYNTSWPQSYRQSIDLYSSVPSPSIGFLGTPTLSRFGSSFLSSSLTRRHTPETLPTVTKPLLDEQQQQQRRSSHSLLPPIPSRRSSIKKGEKPSKVSHELPNSHQCSYGQSLLNGINVLCGVGILSTPYAVKEGGWAGLSILFVFAVLSFYTGILLRYCLDSEPGLETYPDIGQAAFGKAGRIAVSVILYAELYACCIEYIILESDNLSSLFPNAHLSLGSFNLNSHILFALMTTVAVLPTVWLRDLSVLSYISAGGVIASVLVVLCLFWAGLVDEVGFQSKETTLNLATLPVAIGLYGYCYSGHAVFPNIYTSMARPSQYPAVLLTCFGVCTLMFTGVAVMGYKMFGESTLSQFTLNMPQDLVATKIAVWTTVVNPLTKYALTMSPVAMSLEEFIPANHSKSFIYCVFIRTALVVSTLIVGLAIPFFGLVMSLIGSLLTMLVTLILPCACFLSILRGKITRFQAALCSIIITVGVISSAFGTYSALAKIVENLSH